MTFYKTSFQKTFLISMNMKKETYILLKRDYLYKANKPDKRRSIRFNYNHAIISKPFENLIYPSIKRSYISLAKGSTIFPP